MKKDKAPDPMVTEIVEKIEAEFDEWIDVTGAISRHNGWYHECKSFIQDTADAFATVIHSQTASIAVLTRERKYLGELHRQEWQTQVDRAEAAEASLAAAQAVIARLKGALEQIAATVDFRHASGVHDYSPALSASRAQEIAFTALADKEAETTKQEKQP